MKHSNKKLKEEDIPEQAQKTPSTLECVLPEEFTRETLPMVDIYVGTVPNKKLIRNAILDLNKCIPISELQHLKRVKNDKLIICFASEGTEQEVFFLLSKLAFNFELISDKLEVFSVAKCAPKTRRQFLFSNKIWPTNFHEDKYLERLLSGTVFSVDEVRKHERWMQIALEAGRRSGGPRNGAVVVARDAVAAVASDSRDKHPLKHAVMVAVDLVARAQGGGAWDPHPADFYIDSLPTCEEDPPYLCTGYTLYTLREPCTMCAMALVHSRIKRVFYGVPSQTGALGTLEKIHTVKNLNHHFEVFKGLLQNEINSLFSLDN